MPYQHLTCESVIPSLLYDATEQSPRRSPANSAGMSLPATENFGATPLQKEATNINTLTLVLGSVLTKLHATLKDVHPK